MKMAKFAIALCVLFVACNALAYPEMSRPGADEPNVNTKTEDEEADEILEEINTSSHWINDEAKTKVNEIEQHLKEATQAALIFQKGVNSDIQHLVDQHNEIINGIISAAADAVQCAASNINITEIATNVVLDSMACVNGKLDSLSTKGENLIIAYENLKSSITTLQADANKCEWGLWSRLTCVRNYLRQLNSVVLPNTYSLVQKSSELALEIYNFLNTLWSACYVDSAKETFANAAGKIMIETAQCIADFKPASVGSISSTV